MPSTSGQGTRTAKTSSKPAAAAPGRRSQKQKQKKTKRQPCFGALLKSQLSQRPLPLWAVVIADALAFAIAINVFALFHHVLPRDETSVGIVSQRVSSAAPAAVEAQPEAAEVLPEAVEGQPEAAEATEAPPADPELPEGSE